MSIEWRMAIGAAIGFFSSMAFSFLVGWLP